MRRYAYDRGEYYLWRLKDYTISVYGHRIRRGEFHTPNPIKDFWGHIAIL